MKAKTLLLTAVLSAATLAAVAQTPVYSVNAVGYVNVTVPANSFALLMNPLKQLTNSLAAVLPDVPNNTIVYKYDAATSTFGTFTKRATGWTGTGAADARLNPGEGFFIKNAGTAPLNITFVGEVTQGQDLSIDFSKAGFYLIGSIVPQAGKVETDLKLAAVNGDKIFRFDSATQQYTTITKRPTGWTPGGEPSVNVAEGFFYQATAPGKWTRSFSVNQ